MAENTKRPEPEKVVTEIAYCPHLGLYHYKRSDGEEFLFDVPKLEMAVEEQLKAGQQRFAEFMALLTAAARKYPHQRISVDPDGNMVLKELPVIPPISDEGPGSEGQGEGTGGGG